MVLPTTLCCFRFGLEGPQLALCLYLKQRAIELRTGFCSAFSDEKTAFSNTDVVEAAMNTLKKDLFAKICQVTEEVSLPFCSCCSGRNSSNHTVYHLTLIVPFFSLKTFVEIQSSSDHFFDFLSPVPMC